MKNYLNRKMIAIFCVLLLIFTADSALSSSKAGNDPRMVDILITSHTGNVLLYARLVDYLKNEMETAILAGVPAVFTLQLDVYSERSYLWDNHVLGKEIRRTIKYDNLRKMFLITTNGADQPAEFSDLESTKKAMADWNGISVIPLSSLSKGGNYYVKFRVKIDKVRLPLSMEYVLFFVSWWDFETPVYTARFKY